MTPMWLELGFMIWLTAIGGGALVGIPRIQGLPARAALAVPVGFCLYFAVAVVLMIIGVNLSMWLTVGAATVSAAAIAVGARRRGRSVDSRAMLIGVVALVVVAVLTVVFHGLHAWRLTPDSMRYLMLGSLLTQGVPLGELPTWELRARLLAAPLMNAPAGEALHMASIAPLLGVSGLAWLVVLVRRAGDVFAVPRVWSTAVVTAVMLFILSTNRLVYEFFYVNAHLLFGILVLIVIGASWLATVERRWGWLVPVHAALLVLPWIRPEAFIVAALIIVVPLTDPEVPPWARWSLAGTYTLAVAIWFGGVTARFTADLGLDTAIGAAVVSTGLLFAAAAMRNGLVRRLSRYTGLIVVAVLVVGAVGVGFLEPELTRSSLEATWENWKGRGQWRLTWLMLAPLIVATALAVRFERDAYWWVPTVGFLPLLLILAFLREAGYRVGPGDSANRMLVHVGFAAVAYLGIAGVAAMRSDRAEPGTIAGDRPSPRSLDGPGVPHRVSGGQIAGIGLLVAGISVAASVVAAALLNVEPPSLERFVAAGLVAAIGLALTEQAERVPRAAMRLGGGIGWLLVAVVVTLSVFVRLPVPGLDLGVGWDQFKSTMMVAVTLVAIVTLARGQWRLWTNGIDSTHDRRAERRSPP